MNERLDYLREKTYLLTTAPGVYQMKDKDGHIIYIGKAKNLRNRVSSYFAKTPNHTPKVAKMVENVYDYDFIVTNSEYEALMLHDKAAFSEIQYPVKGRQGLQLYKDIAAPLFKDNRRASKALIGRAYGTLYQLLCNKADRSRSKPCIHAALLP